MIKWKVEFDLSWSKYCVITEISRTYGEIPNTNLVKNQVASQITEAIFQINNVKLYVPVVTLSINGNVSFLEIIKQGFKRTISWNKYRSEITTKPKNNNLDYLIDPTFRNFNRLFVLLFININSTEPFLRYYIPLVEIKKFNVLLDNKPFFDQAVKSKQEAYEKRIEISRNDYQGKQIRIFLNKLISQENSKEMMAQ